MDNIRIDRERGVFTYDGTEHPLHGTTARLEISGQIESRATVGRAIAFGLLARPKRTDSRRMFLTIEGIGFGYSDELPVSDEPVMRSFVAAFNGAAAAAKPAP
jgi:hypothetical protein